MKLPKIWSVPHIRHLLFDLQYVCPTDSGFGCGCGWRARARHIIHPSPIQNCLSLITSSFTVSTAATAQTIWTDPPHPPPPLRQKRALTDASASFISPYVLHVLFLPLSDSRFQPNTTSTSSGRPAAIHRVPYWAKMLIKMHRGTLRQYLRADREI